MKRRDLDLYKQYQVIKTLFLGGGQMAEEVLQGEETQKGIKGEITILWIDLPLFSLTSPSPYSCAVVQTPYCSRLQYH